MEENNNLQAPVISLGEWVITLILFMIPCVNIVMLFVFAFGNCNPNKKNYARATLIIMLVVIVLYFIFGAAVVAALLSSTNSLPY